MQTPTDTTPKPETSRTRVLFDLRDELTPEELAKFEASAREAGAASLTDHFLNIALRTPERGAA